MKKYFCSMSVLWILLLAMPLAASTTRIWVLNIESNNISVIDAVTNRVVQTIEGIPEPHGVSFSPDGSRAYVTSGTSEHNLYVVDTKTGKTITKVVLSGRPNLPAITNDGKWVAACIRDPGPAVPIADAPLQKGNWDNRNRVAQNGGAVDFVDTTSLRVKTLPMKGPMHDCYLSPDGKYVVTGSADTNFVAVIDVQTQKLAWEVPFDAGVVTMAMQAGPDGSTSKIFADLHGLDGFVVVDFRTHKEVARIKFPEEKPNEAVTSVSPGAHSETYAQNPENVKKTPTHGTVITPDGKTLWVASVRYKALFVYSLPELKLLKKVPLPNQPMWLTITPDGKTVYASIFKVSLASAIDVKTMKEVALIPVGIKPMRIAAMEMP